MRVGRLLNHIVMTTISVKRNNRGTLGQGSWTYYGRGESDQGVAIVNYLKAMDVTRVCTIDLC